MQVSCEKKLLPYKESQIHTPVSLTAWWTAHRQLVGIIMAAICLNYGPHNVNCNGPPNTDLRNKHLSASVYRHPPPIVIAAGWLTPLQLLCSQGPVPVPFDGCILSTPRLLLQLGVGHGMQNDRGRVDHSRSVTVNILRFWSPSTFLDDDYNALVNLAVLVSSQRLG